jgi:hypothetical protein
MEGCQRLGTRYWYLMHLQSPSRNRRSETHTHPGRKQFTDLEAQKLTGKLGHLAQGATWIFHLLSHLQALIVYDLSKNDRLLLESSKEFQNIVLYLKRTYLGAPKDEAKHISFTMKHAAKLVYHAKYRYNINKSMHPSNRVLPQKAPTLTKHPLVDTYCPHHTKNGYGNGIW